MSGDIPMPGGDGPPIPSTIPVDRYGTAAGTIDIIHASQPCESFTPSARRQKDRP